MADTPPYLDLYQREMGRQRPHHGYLVGSGAPLALDFATYFVKGLNCLDPRGVQPCGQCYCCLREYMAIRHIEPEKGQITIDDIREGSDFLESTSVDGNFRYKALIIEQAEKMTSSDAVNRVQENALLKTLEEPPEGSILFLLSDVPSFFLPTVRSRLAYIHFQPLILEEYRRHLMDLQFSENEIQLLLKVADTSCTSRDDLQFIVQAVALARGILAGTLDESSMQYLMDNADQWQRILRVFHVYFRDALVFVETGKYDKVYKILPCSPYRIIETLQDIAKIRRILSTTHSSPKFQMLSLLSKRRCRIA
ncbi:hypothetical protein Selin_0561 [Desulfurispirillum indicum S5]|uniref:DNA polymerase III gamma/tau subunits-like protein n=1 Tax=Desulfurispirillum indicum (strain ATCC BAA-1389 / DSM 22839 / S5) TaxID=653733 RepID=E6W0X7_DESIS|nr:hypothetical protein [Desulfurispirillum indicum]ADU65309.1 hypothetical protein Selin_0561 [Desulfurispirillum indicum S5]